MAKKKALPLSKKRFQEAQRSSKEKGDTTKKISFCLGMCGDSRQGPPYTCDTCQKRNHGYGNATRSFKIIFGPSNHDY